LPCQPAKWKSSLLSSHTVHAIKRRDLGSVSKMIKDNGGALP
jgi:hypothetical protein